jgi:putative membrane protein
VLFNLGWDEFEGKAYLAILGKVLVFLLVFRSKLAFDRFWSGRGAYGGITGACLQMVQDTSVFFDKDDDDSKECRAELYRLALACMMSMTIHIRKESTDIMQMMESKEETGDESWLPPADKASLELLTERGLLTKEETTKMLKAGMTYPTICCTLCSQKLKDGFQKKMLHRNLMLDIDGQMKAMVAAWSDCQKVSHYPFPFPYVQALSIFNLLYCVSLPISLVATMGPWTSVAAGLITMGFFGLDAVGAQLEDPFGTDPNDLDLGEMAQDACDACYVSLRARDGPDVKRYDVVGVVAH